MRIISNEELQDILEKHKKWLNDEDGGKRAKLRYVYLQGADLYGADLRGVDLHGAYLRHADLRYADLTNTDLSGADLRDAKVYSADLKGVYRPWLVYAGNIGSRRYETLYFADYDSVLCGCWNGYIGGTLDEFKARIDEVYPSNSGNERYQQYRFEYLSAIKMFESMREAYLKSAEKEKDHDNNI